MLPGVHHLANEASAASRGQATSRPCPPAIAGAFLSRQRAPACRPLSPHLLLLPGACSPLFLATDGRISPTNVVGAPRSEVRLSQRTLAAVCASAEHGGGVGPEFLPPQPRGGRADGRARPSSPRGQQMVGPIARGDLSREASPGDRLHAAERCVQARCLPLRVHRRPCQVGDALSCDLTVAYHHCRITPAHRKYAGFHLALPLCVRDSRPIPLQKNS